MSFVVHYLLYLIMTTQRQFYVTLPSNSSLEIFPDNTLTEFKIKLPERVDLVGTWEVGLASITFPHTWFNIRKENEKFYYGDGGIWSVGILPIGYYTSVTEIVEAIDKEIKDDGVTGISLKLDTRSQKVTVVLSAGKKLSFENDLGVILGFGNDIILSKTTTAPFVSDLNIGLQSLFIYLDIIDSQIVGDVRAPLLRIVPARGKDGEIITVNFDNPQYVPLATKGFETVEILITDDTGRKVPFERGRVVITLSFRLRQSPYFT